MELVVWWRIPCFAIGETRSGIMAGWRRVIKLTTTEEEMERLTALSRSRTEPASRVSRAQMLLAYRENPSFCAVGQRVGVHHQTVQRCVERALAYGPLAAIEDRPWSGKEPVITPEAKAWLVSLACDKAQRARLSARVVDDTVAGTSRTRARTGGGARMSRQAGPRHSVQDTRPGGNQTAQGALLSGTSRRRVRAEDGGGSVRLSRGPGPEKGCQIQQTRQVGGDRLLRRKTGNPGHRNDGTRSAAQARRPRHLRAGLRVQTSRHA